MILIKIRTPTTKLNEVKTNDQKTIRGVSKQPKRIYKQ